MPHIAPYLFSENGALSQRDNWFVVKSRKRLSARRSGQPICIFSEIRLISFNLWFRQSWGNIGAMMGNYEKVHVINNQ